jgi:hypothetical protein
MDVVVAHLFFAALTCRISGCPLFFGMASRPPGSLEEKGFGDHGFHVHRDGDEASHAWFEPGRSGCDSWPARTEGPVRSQTGGTADRLPLGGRRERPPYWVQSALPKVFDRISEIQEALFRRVLPFVESLEASEDGLVHVPMYRSDRAFARAMPKMAGWPASLWNSAALRAVDSLDDGREYQFDMVR